MSRTPVEVQAEMLALLPDGWATPNDPNTFLGAMMLGPASEWSLVETAMEAFQTELDPGTAQQLLPDYLTVLGPDPFGRDLLPLSDAQIQALAHQRWVGAATICPGYFIACAAGLGLTMTITEYPLPLCGQAICGRDKLQPWLSQCIYKVTLPSEDATQAHCGQAVCGDRLGSFTPSLMEAFLAGTEPLFTRPVFSYTG